MKRRFVVVSPCSKRRWSDLAGEDHRRFCDVCDRYVHAFDRYTNREQSELWRTSEGRVCGFVQPPMSTRPTRRNMLIGMLWAVAAPLLADDGTIRITVTDSARTIIPGADVSLLDAQGGVVSIQRTDSMGEVVWTNLRAGSHRFKIELSGFEILFLTTVVGTGQVAPVNAVLRVGWVGEVIEVKRRRKRKRWWLFGR